VINRVWLFYWDVVLVNWVLVYKIARFGSSAPLHRLSNTSAWWSSLSSSVSTCSTFVLKMFHTSVLWCSEISLLWKHCMEVQNSPISTVVAMSSHATIFPIL
jgi:hypothetical protein